MKKVVCIVSGLVAVLALLALRQTRSQVEIEPGEESTLVVQETSAEEVAAHSIAMPVLPSRPESESLGWQPLLEAILRAVDSGDADVWQRVLTNEFVLLIDRNPAAAAVMASNIDSAEWRSQALRIVAQQWAGRNPQAALDWGVEHLSFDREVRDGFLADVCLRWSQDNPKAAAQAVLAAQLDEPSGVIGNISQQWAVSDLSAATDWVTKQPAGALRDAAVARIGFVAAQTSPAEAAAWVVQEISTGTAQVEAAMSVLHQWAWRDFDAARAWADRFPEGHLRERAQNELLGIAQYAQEAHQRQR